MNVVEEMRARRVRSTVVARALERGTRGRVSRRWEMRGERGNVPGIRDSRVSRVHQRS